MLDHLEGLTDDVGVFQHAIGDIPNRAYGYCLDDVGRALIVGCAVATEREHAAFATRLLRACLAFVADAQLSDGWFHGFMGYDRRWQDARATPDAVGRALWGLGVVEAEAPRISWRRVARELRVRAVATVPELRYLRSYAYAALGLVRSLAAAPPDAVAVRAALAACAEPIADGFEAASGPGWAWCEDVMTYDNGRLPEALLRAGAALEDERLVRTGLAMLEFLADATLEDGLFVPVGNRGWYPRGGPKAREGQQPLEAAAMVDAALAALAVTGEPRWRTVADAAYGWFLGRNAARVVLARDGGCCDGIDGSAANPNMGAESTLAYLASAIAMGRLGAASLRILG